MSAESVARRIFRRSGVPEIGEGGIGDIATALLGASAIAYGKQRMPLRLRSQPWQIVVRADLSDEELTIAVATGVARWWDRTQPGGLSGYDLHRVACCLVLPASALRDAVSRLGLDVPAIAAEFVCSPALVVERFPFVDAPAASGPRRRPFGLAS